MSEEKQLASIGSVVLVSRDPANNTVWLPAIVEKAGQNNQIMCTAFENGNMVFFDGCRHVADPWWQEDGSLNIAIQENIGAWKLRPQEQDLLESMDFVISTAIAKKPRAKATA